MTDFAAPVISKAYDLVAKRFVSPGEMNPVDFGPFCVFVEVQNGRGIDARFRAGSADDLRPRDSELAPQALEIAQNGLAKNALAGSRSRAYKNR
jgi:hypothetical protein